MNRRNGLAIQSWLMWGVAASFPFLVGRNPYMLLITTLMVGTVAFVSRATRTQAVRRSLIARTVGVITIFAIVFNVLTARTGNQVIVDVPATFSVLSGPITWNAVIYGVLAAVAVLGLVLVWATVGSVINWASLTRIMPERLIGIAVAGSTAINLVPQTVHAVTEIREATAARGFALNGTRGAARLITPVINGGLDRSIRMAEVLEARGFGSRTTAGKSISGPEMVAWNLLLVGSFAAVYGFVSGFPWVGWGGLTALATGIAMVRRNREPDAVKRTRYREESLDRNDWVVAGASFISLIGVALGSAARPDAFRFEPYPEIVAPSAVVIPLLPLFLLIVPALVSSAETQRRD